MVVDWLSANCKLHSIIEHNRKRPLPFINHLSEGVRKIQIPSDKWLSTLLFNRKKDIITEPVKIRLEKTVLNDSVLFKL